MAAMPFLQEGANTSLVWLFYILLAFLLLVIVVGALTSRGKTETASKSGIAAEKMEAKPKSPEEVKRMSSRKKSKSR